MKSHCIQSQIFELSATGGKTALQWETMASKFQQDVILKTVEECFDKISIADQYLIIDKLEVDLGVFSPESFEKEGKQRLIEQLNSVLNRMQNERAKTSVQAQDKKHYFINDHHVSKVDFHGNEQPEVMSLVIGTSQVLYNALIYFVLHGRFPWWYNAKDYDDNVELQFSPEWFSSLNAIEKNEFRNVLYNNDQAIIRIVNQFPAKWIARIFESVGWSGDKALGFWKIFVVVSESFASLQLIFKQNFWILWIVSIRNNSSFPDMKKFVDVSSNGDQVLYKHLAETFQDICLDSITNSNLCTQATIILKAMDDVDLRINVQIHRDSIDEQLSQRRAANSDSKNENVKHLNYDHKHHLNWSTIDDLLKFEKFKLTSDKSATSETRFLKSAVSSKTSEYYTEPTDASLFVQAAGLVLLHPFLVELFNSTGLLKDRQWSTVLAPYSAIKFLSFLVFGDEDVPEYNLVFHKVLLNLPIEDPLLAVPLLTSLEKETCEDLLKAVISHWKALRKTSTDGLRETFLQREGKLTTIDNGYKLLVERKTQDVLLTGLPWGYTTIKLPWMNKMLYVDWI